LISKISQIDAAIRRPLALPILIPQTQSAFHRSHNKALPNAVMHGIQLIKEFRSLNPAAAILALSEQADAFSVQRAFRAGARGYLSIEDAPELLRAFDEISTGRPYVGASVLPLILSNFACGAKNVGSSDINSLTNRELEIFSFIGRGLSSSELANELNVSIKTIETHQMRMKEKLGVHTAAELRQKAREWLARSAVNRIREDPESVQANGARLYDGF